KDKIRVDRLSRHLYDIFQMSKKGHGQKAIEKRGLYETIEVKHRHSFTRLGGVDYNLHQPQTIDFIPPEYLHRAWVDEPDKLSHPRRIKVSSVNQLLGFDLSVG